MVDPADTRFSFQRIKTQCLPVLKIFQIKSHAERSVLQNRFRQEYNVSVSGATDKTDYFISAGYLEDPSYIQGSSFNRYNVRSNINSQITKWLKAGINMAYSRRAVQSPAPRYGRNPGSADTT